MSGTVVRADGRALDLYRPGGVFPIAQASLYGARQSVEFQSLPKASLVVRGWSGGGMSEVSVDTNQQTRVKLP
ncbi:hypothetical protein [Enhygromyxa salina]|uniref:hypothetical protein n=1 Tax=Enhygromyxa salina TaxID=215803 RepID=UPI000D096C8A|nr:hypothetical protein [Enhygromyxa salina]